MCIFHSVSHLGTFTSTIMGISSHSWLEEVMEVVSSGKNDVKALPSAEVFFFFFFLKVKNSFPSPCVISEDLTRLIN